ncbi:MAG: aminomethyl-transferring glycine dehydrogenase subunit GcvPA [Candidatus Polarisedimenticolia bacterium]
MADGGHRYVPASEQDRQVMLRAIGAASIEDLFASIPRGLRIRGRLEIPGPLSETEVMAELETRAGAVPPPPVTHQFLGAGAYRHAVPSLVDHLISRTEFYSSYTPYQPEIAQGTLQAMFEYQTLICQLAELEISNASMYEGGSALAEGILMAERLLGRGRVVISDRVHPEYVQVTRTHLAALGLPIAGCGHGADGATDAASARRALAESPASALVVQHPNFYGCLEDLDSLAAAARDAGAHLIVAMSEPVALGILKGPGRQGADVVLGEAQAFGVPLSYGGPYLGFIAARRAYLRQMPGRIVGETTDVDGRRGYVLTLSTREQHIRREKATSNICTNEGLAALTAAITMAVLGKEGLREMAAQCHAKAVYAHRALAAAGCRPLTSAPFFNEFAVEVKRPAEEAVSALAAKGILAGVPASRWLPERPRDLLVAVTELNTRAAIDRLAAELGGLR